jgi:mono/diheme cytochrome c family protein
MRFCSAITLLCSLAVSLSGEAAHPLVPGLSGNTQMSLHLHGKVLLSELGCTACHTSSEGTLAAKPGPELSSVGARVAGDHLLKFIAEPSAVKPGTTMPDVLGHLSPSQRTETARALAHYLASLDGATVIYVPPKAGAIERGKKLYHSIGCVACHSPEATIQDSVPLGPLEEKYSVASLTKFLEEPLAVRHGGRMPDLKLDHFEAEHIASYLLRKQKGLGTGFKPDQKLVAEGKKLFTQHRCNNCHATGESGSQPSGLPAIGKVRPERGCLSLKTGSWPKYALSDEQRKALRLAVTGSFEKVSTSDQVALTLARMNCLACHQRGEMGGIAAERNVYFTGRDENLGEQGRLPPALTGVGAKLKADWLRDVVVNGASVRPYLNTRMPKFGAENAESLAAHFKELDKLPPAQFAAIEESKKPHEIGRELTGSKAFNCVACHTFRGKSEAAIRAVDLMSMADRLEENWFHQYLADPQQFSPLTIMPSFWPDGKSPLTNILGGDPRQQRSAIWQYLSQGPNAREPQGLVLEPLMLLAEKKAILLRRAYPGIGKRGIGVGYPAGINLSFDAEKLRLASIWTGGFIEASSLWRGQGAGQARILGKDAVTLPQGPEFAVLGSLNVSWPTNVAPAGQESSFEGYTLDELERPTFRYKVGNLEVEDYFKDTKRDGGKPHLTRQLNVRKESLLKGLYFRAAADKSIRARAEREYEIGGKLLLRLSQSGIIRNMDGVQELLVPVTGPIEIEYHLIEKP